MKLVCTIHNDDLIRSLKASLNEFTVKINRCHLIDRINKEYPMFNLQRVDYDYQQSIELEMITERYSLKIHGLGIIELKHDADECLFRITNLLPPDLSLHSSFFKILILGINQPCVSTQVQDYIKKEAEWDAKRLAFIEAREALIMVESDLRTTYGGQCVEFQLPV